MMLNDSKTSSSERRSISRASIGITIVFAGYLLFGLAMFGAAGIARFIAEIPDPMVMFAVFTVLIAWIFWRATARRLPEHSSEAHDVL